VRRDVQKLEQAGVLRTRQAINPGHGRVKIVEPGGAELRVAGEIFRAFLLLLFPGRVPQWPFFLRKNARAVRLRL